MGFANKPLLIIVSGWEDIAMEDIAMEDIAMEDIVMERGSEGRVKAVRVLEDESGWVGATVSARSRKDGAGLGAERPSGHTARNAVHI